jgi:O-antigen/teichoic acid export membrane protein
VAKYIAEINLGTEKQAIYSTLAYLIVMGDVFIQAIGQTFIPRISKYAAENNWKAVKRLKFYFSIICIITGFSLYMASISAGGIILRILFSAEIAKNQHLFSLLMLSGILVYYSSSAGQTLTALKIFKPQPWIHVIVFTVNSTAILIMVNRLGLVGIIYATMIAFTVRIILSEWLLYRHLYLKQTTAN